MPPPACIRFPARLSRYRRALLRDDDAQYALLARLFHPDGLLRMPSGLNTPRLHVDSALAKFDVLGALRPAMRL